MSSPLHNQPYRSIATLYSVDGKRAVEMLEFSESGTYLDEREQVAAEVFENRHGGNLVGPFASPEQAEEFIVATAWFRGESG